MIRTIRATLLPIALAALIAGCHDDPLGPPRPGPEPVLLIHHPAPGVGTADYANVTVFRWRSDDTDSIRHMWSQVVDTDSVYNPSFDIIADLNRNPWRYDEMWSPWIAYDAPGDSGTSTVLGDDEDLEAGKHHVFAVQAKNGDGVITSTFDLQTNARRFRVKPITGPLFILIEMHLGGFKFIGDKMNPVWRDYPSGVPLSFRWRADASSYGGEIVGYRHGWDIADFNAWDTPFSKLDTFATETKLFSGYHTFYAEALDQAGNVSRGSVRIEIVPFPMDRNLMWVDDFFSWNHPIPNYSYPPEYDHDGFWIDICERAEGFDPARDVYDCIENRSRPPSLELVGRYKNIIWTYSNSSDTWSDIIHFVPESWIGQETQTSMNYLSMFLYKGGHLWTLGRSDQSGGLAAALPTDARSFPMHLACEITGNRDDCDGDRSGAFSMAYRDYCISVIDKISGRFRTDKIMPPRALNHYDVLEYAYRDDSDPFTAMHPELPPRLELWEEVTRPGRYFDPDSSSNPGGFTYVEIYDPEYWMTRRRITSRPCFHPMYRMSAKNDTSAVDDCAIAVWVTEYGDIVPDVGAGAAVAAPSVHFGFPLWFFDRESADGIADVIFSRWGISSTR
jgi:hypothetical protein